MTTHCYFKADRGLGLIAVPQTLKKWSFPLHGQTFNLPRNERSVPLFKWGRKLQQVQTVMTLTPAGCTFPYKQTLCCGTNTQLNQGHRHIQSCRCLLESTSGMKVSVCEGGNSQKAHANHTLTWTQKTWQIAKRSLIMTDNSVTPCKIEAKNRKSDNVFQSSDCFTVISPISSWANDSSDVTMNQSV